jgi:PKD repeat protein
MFLDVTFGNQGNETAENVNLILSEDSEFVVIKQPTATLVSIEPGQSILLDNAFDISLTNNVPNGQVIDFLVSASDGSQTWESNFSLTANAPVLQYAGFSISDPSGNNNGLLDPGETVDIIVTVDNSGAARAINVLGQLESSSPHISILSGDPQLFGDVNPDESSSASFEIYCSDDAPAGQNIDFTVALTAEKGITASGSFSLIAGQIPVLIVDLDGNKNSADAILESINGFGVAADFTETFPVQPELYSSIFLCLGIYSNNSKLTNAQGLILADYLSSGGNLYIEGGDTWAYDAQTAVHAMFGINGIADGSGDLETILGVTGTLTGNMSFSYSGDNNWIDHLETTVGGELILNNQTPAYGCGVISQGANYKTIGLSLEFGGLSEEKDMLMEQFLQFFDLLPVLNADFTADQTDIIIGESVQFTSLSSGSPESYSWLFPGGEPAQSTQENPLVVYNTAGVHDVSLTVSSGGSSSSITKSEFIVVQAALSLQSISLSEGWNGISACLIPENTDLYVLLDQYIDDITIMQNMHGVFYPDLVLNTLGEWNYQSGYLLKAENDFVMEITGTEPEAMQTTLKAGWNILPILSECNVVLEDLIALVSDKVTVIKEVAGTGVYWPGFGVNTIGNLQPGQAYFIHVTESVTITFEDCD